MCSGSEAGSYLRLVDCVYHSTLGLRVMKKKTQMKNKWIGLFMATSPFGDLASHKLDATSAEF